MASTFSLLSMRGLGSAFACALLFGTASLAVAQQKPAADKAEKPAAAAAATESKDNWKKLCNEDPGTKKVFCVTEYALRDTKGNLAGSVGIREFAADKKNDLVIVLPPGVNLKYGVQVKLDDKDFTKGPYERCFPRGGCIAVMEMKADNIAAIKKGQKLQVAFVAPDDKGYTMAFSLTGFTAVSDSEGTDLRKVAEERKKLEEGLQKRAQEASERLLENAKPQ